MTLKSQNLSAALVREGFLKILEEPSKKKHKKNGDKTEKKRKKLGQFPSEGGGFPCPNFFFKG